MFAAQLRCRGLFLSIPSGRTPVRPTARGRTGHGLFPADGRSPPDAVDHINTSRACRPSPQEHSTHSAESTSSSTTPAPRAGIWGDLHNHRQGVDRRARPELSVRRAVYRHLAPLRCATLVKEGRSSTSPPPPRSPRHRRWPTTPPPRPSQRLRQRPYSRASSGRHPRHHGSCPATSSSPKPTHCAKPSPTRWAFRWPTSPLISSGQPGRPTRHRTILKGHSRRWSAIRRA